VTKTNAIIIDKDLTNIDLLSQFFVNVQLLLCNFHVLKYVKLKIHKLQVELSKREALMEAFNKVLYSRDESTLVKSVETLLAKSPDDFKKYLQDNWLNRKEMWVTFYRKTFLNFDTDTNNHIESLHNLLKLRIDSYEHLDVCIQKLYDITFEKLERENIESNTIKQRKLDQNDCILADIHTQKNTGIGYGFGFKTQYPYPYSIPKKIGYKTRTRTKYPCFFGYFKLNFIKNFFF